MNPPTGTLEGHDEPRLGLPDHTHLPDGEGGPARNLNGIKWILPDHRHLPDKDGEPVRNTQEPMQSRLLTNSLLPVLHRLHPAEDFFIGEDCGIFWRFTEPPLQGRKAPDWYYVPGVSKLWQGELRRSYVMWQEIASPYLILEFASRDGSEERDCTPGEGKFWVYERRIRPAFYGIYEVELGTIELHHLLEDHFERVTPNEHGRYALPALGVELGIWQGQYEGMELPWMRWWDQQGVMLPISEEVAEREKRRADQEKQRADQEKQRADKLAEKLRSLGINPEEI